MVLRILGSSRLVPVVVATGSCNRSFQKAIAPDTFLREVLLAITASSSACNRLRQMRIYLVRIPRRKGHSIQRVVQPGFAIADQAAASTVRHRVGPNGRDLKLPGNLDRTTSRILTRFGSFFWLEDSSGTMQLAWTEDRALLWKQPERRSRGQDRMGAARCRLFSIRDWHESDKSVRPPPVLDTLQRFFVYSACAK